MNIVTILLIVNVFAAIGIIALVLMQQSKGDMGSAFGGGGSQSMFGSRGSANFLTRATSTLVTVFFISSLALAYTYAKRNQTDEQINSISIDQSEVPQLDNNVTPSVEESSVPSIEGSSVPSVNDSSVEEGSNVLESGAEALEGQAETLNAEAEALEDAVDSEVPSSE